jgi:hypothetical protein
MIKNTKTKTTSLSSNFPERMSRQGRSSSELIYAGAKILAGNYKPHPIINSSLNKDDAIPVRIRSTKKMGKQKNNYSDLQSGSKKHSLSQQKLLYQNTNSRWLNLIYRAIKRGRKEARLFKWPRKKNEIKF